MATLPPLLPQVVVVFTGVDLFSACVMLVIVLLTVLNIVGAMQWLGIRYTKFNTLPISLA